VLRIVTPGGGGYGDPGDRDRDALERDLAAGKVTNGGSTRDR
jgi:N-methylhydantoinase B